MSTRIANEFGYRALNVRDAITAVSSPTDTMFILGGGESIIDLNSDDFDQRLLGNVVGSWWRRLNRIRDERLGHVTFAHLMFARKKAI